MEDAPLNLAHFYERKANKFLKHHRFDDAIECFQMSLDYISEAFKTVQMPKAIEVLVVQEEEYKRQIRQILYKKAYYDSKKQAVEHLKDTNKSEEPIAQISRNPNDLISGNKTNRDNIPNDLKKPISESNEYKIYEDERRLLNLDFKITEIPNLAPLELPNFDFKVFQHTTCGISSKKD